MNIWKLTTTHKTAGTLYVNFTKFLFIYLLRGRNNIHITYGREPNGMWLCFYYVVVMVGAKWHLTTAHVKWCTCNEFRNNVVNYAYMYKHLKRRNHNTPQKTHATVCIQDQRQLSISHHFPVGQHRSIGATNSILFFFFSIRGTGATHIFKII